MIENLINKIIADKFIRLSNFNYIYRKYENYYLLFCRCVQKAEDVNYLNNYYGFICFKSIQSILINNENSVNIDSNYSSWEYDLSLAIERQEL